jgi:hypothetical protein
MDVAANGDIMVTMVEIALAAIGTAAGTSDIMATTTLETRGATGATASWVEHEVVQRIWLESMEPKRIK